MHMPNGVGERVEPSHLTGPLADTLKSLQTQGKFIIGYAGAIGLANSLDSLIKSLPLVDKSVVLVAVGDGECVRELESLAIRLGVSERVGFFGRINQAEVSCFLNMVDAAYLGAKRSSLYRFGCSMTKMNDYALAELPVIYGVGDRNNPVALSGCGIQFRPESSASCADAINRLFTLSFSERKTMGRRGREWVLKSQLWSEQACRFIDRLESIKKNKVS